VVVEWPWDGLWWLVVDWRATEVSGGTEGMAWRQSHCDKVGAAVLVLVLVLIDTVCVGGERLVGGVVGAAGTVEMH
jgi:hypothetical protein